MEYSEKLWVSNNRGSVQLAQREASPIKKYEENPLDIPTYSGTGVLHPSVLYFPEGLDGYKFWLYYTPFPPEKAENPCVVRSNDGIKFKDKGVKNPLITPSSSGFDNDHLMDPDVIYVNGRFFMLYSGYETGGISQIGLAESRDGKDFSKNEKNPILKPTQSWELGQGLECPTVYFDGGIFHVLYEALGLRKVGYASGESLIDLHKYDGNPVFEGGPKTLIQRFGHRFPFSQLFRIYAPVKGIWDAEAVNHLKFFRFNERYYLFYVGRDRPWSHDPTMALGLAKAEDLTAWNKFDRNPILSPSSGWEALHIYRASPVIVGDQIYLYYSAFSRENTPYIGLAFLDLKRFSKIF